MADKVEGSQFNLLMFSTQWWNSGENVQHMRQVQVQSKSCTRHPTVNLRLCASDSNNVFPQDMHNERTVTRRASRRAFAYESSFHCDEQQWYWRSTERENTPRNKSCHGILVLGVRSVVRRTRHFNRPKTLLGSIVWRCSVSTPRCYSEHKGKDVQKKLLFWVQELRRTATLSWTVLGQSAKFLGRQNFHAQTECLVGCWKRKKGPALEPPVEHKETISADDLAKTNERFSDV